MFKPIETKSISEQVVDQIKDMILRGELKKNDKLPSEREMAKDLHVSRTSVREAIHELEIIGLVETRPGEGTFIKDEFDDILTNSFSVLLLINQSNISEILELRKIIERGSIALAAERMTDQEIQDIEKLLDQAKHLTSDDELVDYDVEFHSRIVRGSKNFLLQSLLNATSSLIEYSISNVRANILKEPRHKGNIVDQHDAILQALKSRDGAKAAAAMDQHLNYVNAEMEKAEKAKKNK